MNFSVKKAILFNGVSRYFVLFSNILFTAVLSRILTPQDYGIVAIVLIFTTFFSLLSDAGLGPAIIQNQELTEKDVSDIFKFTVYLAGILLLVFCALGFPISIIYKNGAYIKIFMILSFSIGFTALNIVPNALLRKKKEFVKIGVRAALINIITGISGIILAKFGAKYYALVFQSIVSSLATFVWNYFSIRQHLKLKTKYKSTGIKKVKSYSSFQYAFNLINYFMGNFDSILVGKFIGVDQLAFYSKSYTLTLYPVNYLTYVITGVMHPVLSEHQKDINYIYSQYLKVAKILSLIGVFLTVFCFTSSKEIILILYGSQWYDSIAPFKLFSLSIVFQMTVSSAGLIYLSLGNTKLMLKSGIIFTSTTIICDIAGILTGDINKLALLVTISILLKFLIDFYFLIKKVFKYNLTKFLKIFIPDIFIMAFLFLVTFFASMIQINQLALSAAYKFMVCLVAYGFGLIITKQHTYLALILPDKFKKRFLKVG